MTALWSRAGVSAAPPPARSPFPGAAESPRQGPPGLGEHTRQGLAEAGHATDVIEAMLATGAAMQGAAG